MANIIGAEAAPPPLQQPNTFVDVDGAPLLSTGVEEAALEWRRVGKVYQQLDGHTLYNIQTTMQCLHRIGLFLYNQRLNETYL